MQDWSVWKSKEKRCKAEVALLSHWIHLHGIRPSIYTHNYPSPPNYSKTRRNITYSPVSLRDHISAVSFDAVSFDAVSFYARCVFARCFFSRRTNPLHGVATTDSSKTSIPRCVSIYSLPRIENGPGVYCAVHCVHRSLAPINSKEIRGAKQTTCR